MPNTNEINNLFIVVILESLRAAGPAERRHLFHDIAVVTDQHVAVRAQGISVKACEVVSHSSVTFGGKHNRGFAPANTASYRTSCFKHVFLLLGQDQQNSIGSMHGRNRRYRHPTHHIVFTNRHYISISGKFSSKSL